MRIYSELAPWYQLLTHPSDYAIEADYVARVIEATVEGPAETLLELGTGGGANASYLKARSRCTLTDLSEDMLDVSRALDPECEHVQGDMRSLRLESTFDAVLLHDAVTYTLTEDDLRAAIATAAAHLRPAVWPSSSRTRRARTSSPPRATEATTARTGGASATSSG